LLNHSSIIVLLLLLSACNLQAQSPTPSPKPIEIPSEAIPSTDEWETIAEGLETRVYIPNEADLLQMRVLRIDPTRYQFRAIYEAGNPLRLSEWVQAEPDAHIIINANFFDPQHHILGLLVSDGQVYGQSYQNQGGTFVVQNGNPTVRANRTQPYQGEALEQAVQAFPLLVENGQATYFNTQSAEQTRRTVIAQDTNGHILIMATPFLGLSLADLSAYLPTTDMNIVTAFNLDGGGSTMMAIPGMDFNLPSIDRVPAILAVYPR